MESAVYCRVSTEEQAQEGFSIRAQEQKLKDYAKVKDWSIYNIYIDEGISGKNITERPAVNRMIDDIRAGHVKNVLVFKLDRLTRSVADLVYLMDVFNQNGCAFNSLMESLDTSTASGRMFIKIIGIFAEFERENIAERVRIGKERKAKEGFTTACPHISYGYDRPNGERIQTVNDEEAENVRRIFDMYVNQGMSLSAIARSFNMQKIPSKKGRMWGSSTIKSTLTNCNYVGNVRYSMKDPGRGFEAEGKHEAIISEELYQQAQDLIAKNRYTAPTKKPDERNYLVNFLYCAECGEKYHPHNTTYDTKKGRSTCYGFMCRSRYLSAECSQKNVTAGKVENALIEYFSTYDDVFDIDSGAAALIEQEMQNNEAQIQNLRDRLRHYETRSKEVMSHYLDGVIEFDNYRKMIEQLDSDKAFIRAELAKLTNDGEDGRPATISHTEVVKTFCENWQGLTSAEKRLFLTNYIKKITVSNEAVEGSRYGNTKIVNVEFNSY